MESEGLCAHADGGGLCIRETNPAEAMFDAKARWAGA
jgi:hypothetical protein